MQKPNNARQAGRESYTQNSAILGGNDSASQRARILDALRQGPLSTLAARKHLDVLHPAARIQQLREAGHNIHTHWATEESQQGRKHRIAVYVLLPGKWEGRT